MDRVSRLLRAVVSGAVAAVLVSGCGSSHGDSRFVGHDSDTAVTVSWVEDGNERLTGSVQFAELTSGGSSEVTATSASFTGTLHSGQVGLTIQGIFGTDQTWTGHLDGRVLTLNVPAPDGTVSTMQLSSGSVEDYNTAVRALSQAAGQQRTQAAETSASTAAVQAAAQASAAAEAELEQARNNVTQDVAAIKDALDTGIDTQTFASDLDTQKTDVQTTLDDAATAKSEGPSDPVACGDASVAQGDASAVAGDESAIQGDAPAAQAAIDDLKQDLADLGKHLDAYQADALQQGSPADPATLKTAATVQKQAADAAASWKTTVAGYLDSAHKLTVKAQKAADAAEQAVC